MALFEEEKKYQNEKKKSIGCGLICCGEVAGKFSFPVDAAKWG